MGETPVGLTKDVGWQIGVQRTLPGTLDEIWDFLVHGDGLAVWLGQGAEISPEKGAKYETDIGTRGEVRSFRPHDRVRLTWRPSDWDHDVTLQVAVTERVSGTAVRFHQEHLADQAEREQMRAHWEQVLEGLGALLESGGAF